MTFAANLASFVSATNISSAGALSSALTASSLTVSGASTTGAQQVNVNSAGSISTAIQVTDASSGAGAFSVVTFGGALATAHAGDILVSNNVGNVIISPNAGNKSLYFVGGSWTNSPGLTVNGSNYVGVGTTSPSYPLDVQQAGNAALRLKSTSNGQASLNLDTSATSGTSNQVLFLRNGTSYWALGGGYIGSGGVNDFSLYNYTTSSNALIVLNSNNYVGIGTSTPTATLTVQTSDGSSAGSLLVTDGTNYTRFGTWDGANNRIESVGRQLFITSYTGGVALGYAGSAGLTVNSSNNVGIGVTTPSYPLQVAGTTNLNNGSNMCFYNYSNGNNGTVYIHMKTNLNKTTSQMYCIEAKGYIYGQQQSIGGTWVGYMYTPNGTSNPISTGNQNYGQASFVNSQYLSSDGYLVIVGYCSSLYYTGFTLNNHTTTQGLYAFTITTSTTSASSTGAY